MVVTHYVHSISACAYVRAYVRVCVHALVYAIIIRSTEWLSVSMKHDVGGEVCILL